MKKNYILPFTCLILLSLLSFGIALTQTGESSGSFDVDAGDAGIIIDKNNPNTNCTEDWSCSAWSSCSSGIQTFVCSDCNSCGTYKFLPSNCAATQNCNSGSNNNGGSSKGSSSHQSSSSGGSSNLVASIQCTENWECSPWSDCIDSNQTRACKDNNNCGTATSKPAESTSCDSSKNNLITGAAIGDGGDSSLSPYLVVGLLVIVVAAAIITYYRRRRFS